MLKSGGGCVQRTELKMDGGVQGLCKCDTVGEIKILEMDDFQVLNLHEARAVAVVDSRRRQVQRALHFLAFSLLWRLHLSLRQLQALL